MDEPDAVEKAERRAGLLLVAAALAALIAANSALHPAYHAFLDWKIGPALPRLGIPTIEQWIADGAMALFFLLVGLEVKREWLEGRLARRDERMLPILAAAGGMAMPALVYVLVAGGNAEALRGWAIPAATDIAFAIGVLALLGRHAPPAIKLLLVTIAIVDDIGAVVIIALFYTAEIDLAVLAWMGVVMAAMATAARAGVRRLSPYLAGFLMLWLLTLASGIHPTIAGILAAITVPIGAPLRTLEHRLHPWVMFLVVPLFGLASAGVAIEGGAGEFVEPVALGVMLGLFVGKQAGIFGAVWLAVRSGVAAKPAGVRWRQIYGAALLCGIGFTMSLFIAALAFPGAPMLADEAKLGVLSGSLLSALAGYATLRLTSAVAVSAEDDAEADRVFSADED